MANTLAIFQSAPRTEPVKLTDADGTSLIELWLADATNGSLIDNIAVTSTDTVDATLVLTISDGTTDSPIGLMVVPAGAGTDGSTLPINLLNGIALPYLQSKGGLPLGAGITFSVNAQSGLSAATEISFVSFGGDY